jgi:hypothetical protein
MEYYVYLNYRLRHFQCLFFRTVTDFVDPVFAQTSVLGLFSRKLGLNSGTGVFGFGLVGRSFPYSENLKAVLRSRSRGAESKLPLGAGDEITNYGSGSSPFCQRLEIFF